MTRRTQVGKSGGEVRGKGKKKREIEKKKGEKGKKGVR